MEQNLCLGCMEYMEPEVEYCGCGYKPDEYEPEPHHLRPGTMLRERYQVGRVMGEGGFGITYVGRDTVLDLKVAVKEFYMSGYVNRNNTYSTLVRASVGSHTELFERNREKFLTEARVLAKFANEEGIVGIRDFFEENNTAYIVMNFLTGETLRDYLKEHRKISWEKTIQIMNPVINSLGTVHNHKVIHRDISPDNIMLTNDGKVKLLDFGAAREVSQTDIKSLSVILKPGYAPEEQYRSKGQQGPWTDIYALCATMYCCISGVVPDDSMERMFEDKLKPLCEVEPACSVAISNVIAHGMAVRQKDRYQSIEELRKDLDKALANPDDASVAGGVISNSSVQSGSEPVQWSKNSADDNATVYAAEMKAPGGQGSQSSQNADNATVYAGKIEDTVTKPEEAEVKTVETMAKPENKPEEKATVKQAQQTIQPKPEKKAEQAIQPKPEKKAEQTIQPKPVKQAQQPKTEKQAERTQEPGQRREAKQEKKRNDASGNKKVPVVLAGIIVLGIVVLGIVQIAKTVTFASHTDEELVQMGLLEVAEIPEELSDYRISLDGKTITLPATYQDFVDAGWEVRDVAAFEKETLSRGNRDTNYTRLIKMEGDQGTESITVHFYNPSSSDKAKKDCWIYKVALVHMKDTEVVINDNVVCGRTKENEFCAMYTGYTEDDGVYYFGSETSAFASSGQEIDGAYEFDFNGINGKGALDSVTVTCFREPKNFTDTFAKTAPAYDEEAFAQMTDFGCEVVITKADDTVYALKAGSKLREYADMGWELQDNVEFLPARGQSESVKLKADARRSCDVYLFNPYAEAMAIEECVVSELSFNFEAVLSDDTWNLVFGDGTAFDETSAVEDIKAYLDKQGITYNAGEGYLHIYPEKDNTGKYVSVLWMSNKIASITFECDSDDMKKFFRE